MLSMSDSEKEKITAIWNKGKNRGHLIVFAACLFGEWKLLLTTYEESGHPNSGIKTESLSLQPNPRMVLVYAIEDIDWPCNFDCQ